MSKIRNRVKEAIIKNDAKFLDLIIMLIYSLPSFDRDSFDKETPIEIERRKNKFRKCFYIFSTYNLQTKFNIKKEEAINIFQEKIDIIDFTLKNLNSYNHNTLFNKRSLIEESSDFILKQIKTNLSKLEKLEKVILILVLKTIKFTLEKRRKRHNVYLDYQYYNFYSVKSLGISCYTNNSSDWNEKTGKIFINFEKKLNDLFNLISSENIKIFDNEIKIDKVKVKFWKMGEILLKLGVGYWLFTLNNSGNIKRDKNNFLIPEFIYYLILKSEMYKKLVNSIKIPFMSYIKGTSSSIKKKWDFLKEESYLKEEIKSNQEITEADIERILILDLDMVEKGLQLIDNQYATDVGIIDILCIDKNENYVVIEIKKGRASDKVVGQIQRYLNWVQNNLAKEKKVRGVIVCKEYNKKIVSSINISKIPIEIKRFGLF